MGPLMGRLETELQQEAGPGDTRVLATFVVLILTLSWLARGVG